MQQDVPVPLHCWTANGWPSPCSKVISSCGPCSALSTISTRKSSKGIKKQCMPVNTVIDHRRALRIQNPTLPGHVSATARVQRNCCDVWWMPKVQVLRETKKCVCPKRETPLPVVAIWVKKSSKPDNIMSRIEVCPLFGPTCRSVCSMFEGPTQPIPAGRLHSCHPSGA